MSYDYSGYGNSEGVASVEQMYKDIEEVAEFMKNTLSINYDKIVL